MMEVDLMFVVMKLRIVVFFLLMGDREDLVCFVFDGKVGEGVVVLMVDFGMYYKLLINEVEVFEFIIEVFNLFVVCVLWKIKLNFYEGVYLWI